MTSAIDESKPVHLAGNTRPEANAINDRGAVADDFALEHMELQLRLPAENEQALDQLIDQLHDPNSPSFHQWLTPEQFQQQFSPAAADVSAVTGWLQSHGFTVNVTYPRSVDFSGTAGQVRSAFRTEIHHLDVNGAAHIANMSDPEIPAALAPVIAGVFALNDFMPHPMSRPHTAYTVGGGEYALVPADLATIYNFNPLFARNNSGQGQTIVVVEDSDVYSTADWSTFRSTLGLSSYTSGSFAQIHPAPPSGSNNCRDPGANGDDAEATLDAEWASAAAPSATIQLASCRDTTNFGGFIALENLLNASTTPPAIVSISYGDAESDLGSASNAAISALYQQAAAEGVSVFAAAGDQGAAGADPDVSSATHGIGISGFASTPYDVAVGGTDFGDTYAGANATYWSSSNAANFGSAESYIPEIPWDNSCASGLIASFLNFESSSGTSGLCNSTSGANFLTTAAGSGGPSGCATGAPATTDVVGGSCAGYPKPSWQSVAGNPTDGVRDIPDVALFAANGVWGHYYIICYSDTRGGGASCAGVPSTWSGFGGTSFASPIMAGIQALVNQSTGSRWGNPNPTYYSLAATEYGASGSAACNSTLGNSAASSCIFYDVTQGDMDVNCTGTQNCYLPSGTYGVLSISDATFQRAYATNTGWDFATGIGTVNVSNLVGGWPGTQLKISTQTLPNGAVGTSYSATLTASGGTTPYTWALTSGALPNGLALNSSTGQISGTPTATANASALTFRVTDSSSPAQTASVSLTLTIASASLSITTAALPSGQVGTAYSTTLAASGGIPPYTWTLTSGTLPSGLTLNSATGQLSGTPTAAAIGISLTFEATDSSSPAETSTANLTLTIAPITLTIITATLPNGQVGTPYSATLQASGGSPPYTWTLFSGVLPAGLALNSSAGQISGIPTAAANATVLTFKATDSSSPAETSTVNLTLTIAPAALTITSATLPGGQVGTAYSAMLAASGGTTPYTWALVSGTLPAGLALNGLTGQLSGTPTAAANAVALTFKATDSSSPVETASATLTLTIAPATLRITTSSVSSGQAGTAYLQALTATGGTAPYSWLLTSGALPAGLELNAQTGILSGTPTAAANATPLTFKVTDSGSPPQTSSVNLTLTVIFPYTVGFGTNALTVASPGGSGSTAVTLTPVAGFTGTVNLTCSVTYNGAGAATDPPTCSLSAAQLNLSGSSSSSTITVTTTPATSAALTPASNHDAGGWLLRGETTFATAMILAMLARRKAGLRAMLLLLFACLAGSTGCGGGSAGSGTNASAGATTNPGTTTGTYTVAVTASDSTAPGSISASAEVTLLVQ